MPSDGDSSDDEVTPKTRDRLRSAFLRVSDALRDFFKARANVENVEAAKLAVNAAVGGGVAVALGVWVGWRLGRARLTHANMTQGSILHPGIKTWLSDEIGLIVGPLMAPTLPKNFHDEGIALATRWPVASYFTDPEEAEAHARFAATDWFTISFEKISANRNQVNHYNFTTTSIGMITAVSTAWFWGISVAVQKALEKAIP